MFREAERMVLAAVTFAAMTACEGQPLAQPLSPVVRNPRGSVLLARGRYLELYGNCKQEGVNPFTDHTLAEVQENDRYTTIADPTKGDLVQLIETKYTPDSNLAVTLKRTAARRLYVANGILTQRGATLEELESEFVC